MFSDVFVSIHKTFLHSTNRNRRTQFVEGQDRKSVDDKTPVFIGKIEKPGSSPHEKIRAILYWSHFLVRGRRHAHFFSKNNELTIVGHRRMDAPPGELCYYESGLVEYEGDGSTGSH